MDAFEVYHTDQRLGTVENIRSPHRTVLAWTEDKKKICLRGQEQLILIRPKFSLDMKKGTIIHLWFRATDELPLHRSILMYQLQAEQDLQIETPEFDHRFDKLKYRRINPAEMHFTVLKREITRRLDRPLLTEEEELNAPFPFEKDLDLY